MLVVKIELHSAIDGHVEEIGRMYVANTGGTHERGDYTAAVCRRRDYRLPYPLRPYGPKSTRTGEVKDYPRLSYNVWRLTSRAVRACFPEEQ